MSGRLLSAIGGVLALTYPLVVYLVLDRYGPQALAILVLVTFLSLLVLGARRAGADRRGRLLVPLVAVGLAAASLALREVGLVLLVPVALNAMLGATFAATLFSGPPMIERFARLQHPDLTEPEVAWCRLWTVIWSAFFALNVVLVSWLAFAAPLSWWVAYTGGIAYILMGVLFLVEYLARRLRFQRPGGDGLDRLFGRRRSAPRG